MPRCSEESAKVNNMNHQGTALRARIVPPRSIRTCEAGLRFVIVPSRM